MKNQIIKIKDVKNRKDFISIDNKTVLSAEGQFFSIGDKVHHEGAPDDEEATIQSFSMNIESMDIQAKTTRGKARISFLYTK